MKLADIMLKYGSDKGGDHNTNHNYTCIYDPLLSCLKNKPDVNFFELGIGSIKKETPSNMYLFNKAHGYMPGASQRAWAEWLPLANIYCADVDRDTLFVSDRIKSFYVDQTDPASIAELWNQLPMKFDVIIDDGLHTFQAGHRFLMNSHHKVKEDGLYIIEDIPNSDFGYFFTKIPDYEMYFKSVELVSLYHPRNEGDNNLLICRK